MQHVLLGNPKKQHPRDLNKKKQLFLKYHTKKNVCEKKKVNRAAGDVCPYKNM